MSALPALTSFALPSAWQIPLDLGFSVFPIPLRSKRPVQPWKAYQTERAPLDLVRQWAASPSNVGIVTGTVSGLLVLDLDSDEAVQEAMARGIPDTVTVRTSKGLHAYFQHPGGNIGNRAGLLAGWDIRGDGGYVVAPGSIHETGFTYAWANPPGMFELAPAPAWLLALLAKPEPGQAPPLRAVSAGSAYGERAIDNELSALRRAGEGQRNHALNRAAFSLGQLAAGGVIDEHSALPHLRATATAIGLEVAEIEATLASGWAAGLVPTASLYLSCEDDADQLHFRQERLCEALGVPMASLAGKLHLASLRGSLGSELATFGHDGKMTPTATFTRLVATINATGAKLVILDNVAHLFVGNENDRADVTRFVNLLNKLASDTGAAIILLGHPNKAGDEWSGSTGWNNAVRSRLYLDHDEQTDIRTLSLPKANYSQKGEVARFIWQDWAFVHLDDLTPERAEELRDTVQASADNVLFMACLAERTKQQRAVSEKRGPNFAPVIFAGMPESKSIGKARLEQAMDRLFRIGKIDRSELWKGPDRKPVFGLRATAANGQNGPEMCGKHSVRETRETVLETAENRAGNAATTLSIYNIPGAALMADAPDMENEGCSTDGEPDQ